jgi:hypothetical protein
MEAYLFLFVIVIVTLFILISRRNREKWFVTNELLGFRIFNKTIEGKVWKGLNLKLIYSCPKESKTPTPVWIRQFEQLCVSKDGEFILLFLSLNSTKEIIKINDAQVLSIDTAKNWLTRDQASYDAYFGSEENKT